MKNDVIGFLLLTALFHTGQLMHLKTSHETNIDEDGENTNPFKSLSNEELYSLIDKEYDDYDQLNIAYPAFVEDMDLHVSNPLVPHKNHGVDSVDERMLKHVGTELYLSQPLKELRIPFLNNLFGHEKYVNYFLYTRETINNPEILDSRKLSKFKNFKPDKPIRVIIHGWKGHSECVFSTYMRNGFLPLLDINLILVDWSGHNSRTNFYPLARYQVPDVGRITAEFLDFLATKHGVSLAELHVLGHSLGAHIAGVAGKLVKNGKIGRITGLDPAGPEFKHTDSQGRLSADSALFVDVIHTSGYFLGLADPLGHVDFFPNGGWAIQPGCGLDIIGRCSHRRSYILYVETLTIPYGYPSVACNDWSAFRTYECTFSSVAYMGEKANKTALGKYYLQTNKESPFWRAAEGTRFSAFSDNLSRRTDITD